MHILFLTDNFPPEVNAPAARTFEHCREWVRAGHQVTVITCAPNFPKGKVFAGYANRLWQTESMDGIDVIRVWSYITANEGFARRVLDYVSYMVMAILTAPFVRRINIIVGTSPQLFTNCAALVVSRCKQVPFVFELRDLWPESIRAVGAMQGSPWLDRLERLELLLYRKAAAVVCVTHSFCHDLTRRGIDREKIHVVTNGVDSDRFHTRGKDAALVAELGLQGKFVAGYIGTHGLAHALDTLLHAALLLKDVPDGDRYRIVFLGDGATKAGLIETARDMGLDNVLFLDSVPKDEVVRYWSLLDVSVIHLRKNDLFKTVIPSKLFECMAMGLPVLHGVAGESASIVETERVGEIFPQEDHRALADAIVRLEQDAGLRSLYRSNALVAARKYDRCGLALDMLALLEAIVGLAPVR